MATTNRDVKMTLSVETLGVDGIRKLQDSLNSLAKGGGEAAPEFKRLADEIDRLGQQSAALRTFEDLNRSIEELGSEQATAAQRVEVLRSSLLEVSEAAKLSAQRQAEATAELKRSQDALAQTNGELKIVRNSFDESGKRVATYKADVERLTIAQVEQTTAVRASREVLRDANAELKAAGDAQDKAVKALERQETATQALNRTIAGQAAALRDQGAAVEAFGLSTSDLAQSQAKLLTALNSTGAAGEQLAESLRIAEAAAKDLADQRAFDAQLDEMEFLRKASAAAEAHAHSLRIAEAAAKDLADQRAFDAQLDEMEFLRKASAAAEAHAHSLRMAEAAAEKTAAATRDLARAFDTAGATSADALRKEIEQVRGAMKLLETQSGLTGSELRVAMAAGTGKIKELERDLRAATGAMTVADRAANLFKNSLGQIAAGNLVADAVGFMVEKVKALGREFVTVNIQAEGMNRALNAIYKSSDITAGQIAFLNTAANKAGISVTKISDDFVKFSAATQTSNIPLEQSNALFGALTEASGTLGLGADKVGLALNALGQIASKGVVSMEELRGQLGDSLPGALSLTAQGMGITDAALIKLVESGKLASSTFIPAFTAGLRTLTGENDTLQGSLARLSNATSTFFKSIGEAGALDVMKGALSATTVVAKGLYTATTVVTEGFFSVVRASGAAAGALTTDGNVFAAIGEQFRATNERLRLFVTTLYGTADAAAEAQIKLNALNEGSAAITAGSVAAELSLVKFNAALSDHKLKLEERTKAAETDVKISEVWATNQTLLAKLSGDVSVAIQTEIEASQKNVQAKNQVVSALETELQFHKESLAATELLLSQKTKQTDADIKLVEELQKVVAARQQDVEKAREQAESSRLVVVQAELEGQKYQDNSGRIAELSAAYDSARNTLALLIEQERAGVDVSDTKKIAIENLRNAQGLYNDALTDSVSKIQASNIALKADYELRVSSLELLKANYVAMENNAKAMGNEYQQRQARIGQMQTDIALTKAKVEYMRAEAEGSIAVARAKQVELEASGQLTAVKKAELDATIKMAEAKINESKAVDSSVKELERQLNSYRNGTSESGKFKAATDAVSGAQQNLAAAVSAASDAVERQNTKYMQSSKYSERQIELLEQEVSAQEKLNAVKDRAIALENKRRGVDSEGFSTDTSGKRVTAGVQTEESLFNALKSQGVSEDVARRKARDLKIQYELWAKGTATNSTMGSFSGGELAKNSWLNRPFEEVIAKTASDAKSGAGIIGATAKTYNVQIGGNTIRTASDADAQKLIGALKSASLTA